MKKYANFTEEDLKTHIWQDYFPKFDLGTFSRLDFTLKQKNTDLPFYLLWAEAKKETADIFNSFTQLVLTIGVNTDLQNIPKPPFLAVFDSEKIAFIEYSFLNHFCDSSLFNEISWQNITPSNHLADEFIKTKSRIQAIIKENAKTFYFEKNEKELKHFISNSLSKGELNPVVVTDKNFDYVYSNWYLEVFKRGVIDFDIKEEHSISQKLRDKMQVLESDFFLADLISEDDKTLDKNLRVILEKKENGEKFYNLKIRASVEGALLDAFRPVEIVRPKLHTDFWKMYKRPPLEKFWKEIYTRRDKLAPRDIRERKGAFFTPSVWVKKAQEYLKDSLGENWENEYYVWDCAAGTGNLLVGLKNPARIFASIIDLNDVVMMKNLIKMEVKNENEKLDLLENHIFQFDFLNDDFSKLPDNLQRIIQNEPEKLVIFINPPYAEATASGTIIRGKSTHKAGVASHKTYNKYLKFLGRSANEVFAQFFIRIYKEIPGCVLASFSTLKYVNSQNFVKFRETFQAKFLKGFACPSFTFDNVQGKFPIGFLIWNTQIKNDLKKIRLNIFDENNQFLFKKNFQVYKKDKVILNWLQNYYDQQKGKVEENNTRLAYLVRGASDFQNNRIVFITKNPSEAVIKHSQTNDITKNNLIHNMIFCTVRHSVPFMWFNDRDQFLFPNKKWEKDKEFQNNCFVYALFHGQNKISSKEGVNHFIPFSEKELNVQQSFESHFLIDFMAGKIKPDNDNFLKQNEEYFIPQEPMVFSSEAQNVLMAAKAIYIYYHQIASKKTTALAINENAKYLENAALYDIKEFFQGRNEKGRMNSKSEDLKYTALLNDLKNAQKILAQKIEPKIYEYGFLLE